MWVCTNWIKQAGGGETTLDILEMINYVQLTSQTALFKCHHRTLLGMCLHTKATGLHIQEAAHSLKAPFFAFLTVHSSSVPSFAAWTVFQTLHSSPLCFSSVTITYSMSLHHLSLHGTCHSFPLFPYPCIWLIKHRSHCWWLKKKNHLAQTFLLAPTLRRPTKCIL